MNEVTSREVALRTKNGAQRKTVYKQTIYIYIYNRVVHAILEIYVF